MFNRLRPSSVLAALAVLAVAPLSHALDAREQAFRDQVRPFLAKHCFECHDDSVQEGGVRLDDLPALLGDPKTHKAWVNAFDKIATGEMPPKKKPRPAIGEVTAVTGVIKTHLVAADMARRNVTGRVVLRRLNRTQYENSIRDLLGVQVWVKDILPEDGSAEGFDTVAAALNVSSVLMERYLEAADVALDQAIQSGPEAFQRGWVVGMGPGLGNPNDYRLKQGVKYLPDGTFVYLNSRENSSMLDRWKAPAEGWYRFQVRAYAYQSPGQDRTMHLMAGSFDPKLPRRRTVGYYDVPPTPEKPRVIEFTEYLPVNGTIKVLTHGLGNQSINTTDGAAEYKGPGVAVMPVRVEGPIHPSWPPAGHKRIFGTLDLKKATAADAEKPLTELARRAFRRPVAPAEIKPFVDLVKTQIDAGQSFEIAIRAGLKAILCAPEFLFLWEQPGKLDDFALASRLSYFLWSSTPDDTLLELAASKSLARPEVLSAQVERLLKDPRSENFTTDFTGQWLTLRQLDATTPDKKLYPEFDDYLQWSMLAETTGFFDKLLAEDRSVANFIHSDFSILNERLAAHYGIPGVVGAVPRAVPLPPNSHRGGLLTQAAILKVTANGTVTSPVVRGTWVMRNIVGRPPNPPPPNVPAVEPDIRGAKTIREQLDKHRNLKACAGCHAQIDPPGFAMENFDVIGGWRENYRSLGEGKPVKTEPGKPRVGYKVGLPVNAGGSMADGRSFRDVNEFKQLLLSDKDPIARCIAEKLLVYGTGAALDFADRAAVDQIVQNVNAKGYGFRSLIHEVVKSAVFTSK